MCQGGHAGYMVGWWGGVGLAEGKMQATKCWPVVVDVGQPRNQVGVIFLKSGGKWLSRCSILSASQKLPARARRSPRFSLRAQPGTYPRDKYPLIVFIERAAPYKLHPATSGARGVRIRKHDISEDHVLTIAETIQSPLLRLLWYIDCQCAGRPRSPFSRPLK